MEPKDWEEIEAIRQRQLETGCKKVSRIADDEVLYRGRVIRRHDDVPNGYGGRYSVKAKNQEGRTYNVTFSRQSEAKMYVDGQVKS